VVSALDLVVDRTVTRGFRVAHSVPPSLRGADAARFTITLSRPMLHLRPNAQGFSFLREPEEVVVSFPLPAEDPWAAERKASTLEQVGCPWLLWRFDHHSPHRTTPHRPSLAPWARSRAASTPRRPAP
jgi:hypothetical protein